MRTKRDFFLSPGEAEILRTSIYNLTEMAKNQMLSGLVRVLIFKGSIEKIDFKEILSDAQKYSDLKRQH